MSEALVVELQEQIARRNVVLVVGTGISRTACGGQEVDGHAVVTWPGLLQQVPRASVQAIASGWREDAEAMKFVRWWRSRGEQ